MGNLNGWSELPFDLLGSILQQLSRADFHRTKLVCRNWNSCSKLTVPPQSTTPWLILLPHENIGGCMLYNPEEDRTYKTTNRDFSGSRLLSSSGKWFLVQDSKSYLYIIDVFSDIQVALPPLENIKSRTYSLKRVNLKHREFRREFSSGYISTDLSGEDLMGRLWVDEKTEEYVVVWCFDDKYLGFCKKGDDYYTNVTVSLGVYDWAHAGMSDMVLRGYRLYILTIGCYVRILDLCKGHGFEDVTGGNPMRMSIVEHLPSEDSRVMMTVRESGEVLVVSTELSFRIFKKDPNADPNGYYDQCFEIHSLGDEAMVADLGTTAVHGIEPNSIYLAHSCYGSSSRWKSLVFYVDINVFNLATKTSKEFPSLSKIRLKDARWFLPNT